jgi:lipoprotein-anchoring transpeptidase ErfK/SrfK
MVTPELRKFVADSIALNKTIPAIKKELVSIGWNTKDISEALKEAVTPLAVAPVTVPATPPKTPRSLTHIVIYTFLVLIICALSAVSYYLWKTQMDLSDMNSLKVREFYTELAHAQISYNDAGEIVFPDEQKFLTQKETYVQQESSFIEANLRTMEITLYEHGIASTTLPILTKGKEKSWWETPTGNYKILTKSVNQFSSIGHVWMPYSMQFYGNYFIHGWPYYDDGTPVASTYSGGCIRLATEDAERVYNFAKLGTPILVLEEDLEHPLHTLTPMPTNATIPTLSTQSFVVMDLTTGKVLLERDSRKVLPIHALTKLMNGIVAHEVLYLGRTIPVAHNVSESAPDLFAPATGNEYTGLDLLYPLLMQSSYEPAKILSGPLGGKTFIQNMNTKATSLQMKDTRFVDVSGESAENVASAQDIAYLLQYTYFKRHFIFGITKGKLSNSVGYISLGDTVAIGELKNENVLTEEPNLVGVIQSDVTGETQTLATVWNIITEDREVPVAIVLLDSKNAEQDTKTLYTWVTENFIVE